MSSFELVPNNAYGLTVGSPVVAAAGWFGYGLEYARMVEPASFGAIVSRTTTLRARRFSRPPRFIETPAGLLRYGEWPNPGFDTMLNRYAPEWSRWNVPVIASIWGETVGEYGQMVAAAEGVEGIAAFELALPDDLDRAAAAVRAVRRATLLPVLAKLPLLEAEPLLALAGSLVEAGADALTLFAPPRGLHIDAATGERLEGWLYGPSIRPLVLQRFSEVQPAIAVPLLACGGIASADDAQQFLAAGATAVQLDAVLLAHPFAARDIGQAITAG